MSGHKIEQCTITQEGGHCALHNVEVERRKNHGEKITGMINDIEDLKKSVSSLFNSKYVMYGLSILGTTVLFGGYYYTNDHIKESNSRLDKIEAAALSKQSQISDLKIITAITDDRYKSLTSQLSTLNANVLELIRAIHDKNYRKDELQ